MNVLIEKVRNYIIKENLIDKGDTIGVALSGGMDSVVLLHVLYNLRDFFEINLKVIHFHHHVRYYGCRVDALFVSHIAEEMKLPFIMEEEDIPHMAEKYSTGIEEAGRKGRYDFFRKIINRGDCNKIALAHSASDQAETVLMKILRGTGTYGLSGMASMREGVFIRPVISCFHHELKKYAEDSGLCYRQDQTNGDQNFSRNSIRHFLIPLLKEHFNPNIQNGLLNLSEIAKSENDFLDSLSEKYLDEITFNNDGEKIIIDIDKFSSFPLAMKRRIIRNAILKLSGNLSGIEFKHIERIIGVTARNTGKIITLPGFVVKKDYNHLILTGKYETYIKPGIYSKELNVPGETRSDFLGVKVNISLTHMSCNMNFQKNTAWFDASLITSPLFIRNRREGDQFVPFGMSGKKKLKDFFIDKKIPLYKRDIIPLICDRNNIIWVTGLRTDERFKITDKTEKVVFMEVEYL
jgi:tRNA(Ile)-lysidine synthase